MGNLLEDLYKQLLIEYPFWGLVALGIPHRFSNKISTACIASSPAGFELLFSEEFFSSLKEKERVAVLLHELHHLAFFHPFMINDFSDKERFNIASDMEINDYINNLPDGCIKSKDWNMPYRAGTLWYYHNLPTKKVHISFLIDDHSKWSDISNNEIMKEKMSIAIVKAAEETKRINGEIPGEMKDIVNDLLKVKERVFDWKSYFKRIISSRISINLKSTHKKESVRFPKSPAIKLGRKQNICIAVDTSGSIEDEDLRDFFSEIYHVWKLGVNVHVIEFDVDICTEWDFKGLQSIKIFGRGGTNFHPVISHYMTNKKDFDALIIFTDGFAPVDDISCSDIVWVIARNGDKKDYPGKTIYIK